MSDALNPRQFASLDYADADMYGALSQRPAPAIPLEKPLPVRELNRQNASEIAAEKRLYQEEWQRIEAERAARKANDAAREAEIFRREQAQRQAIANRVKGVEAPELLPPKSDSILAQQQRSTPERQTIPSTGSPAPTLKGTAARADALVEPTATPRSATVREAIANTVGSAANALPKTLPQAAGRLVIPGVAAGLQLGSRLIAGQPVSQAVTATGTSLIGSGIGLVVGNALLPGLGGVVGSMIGGFAGGLLGDSFFRQQLPTPIPDQPVSVPNYPPVNQGQSEGVFYQVSFSWDRYFQGNFIETLLFVATNVRGPIKAIALGVPPGSTGVGAYVIGTNIDGTEQVFANAYGFVPASDAKNMQFLSVTRMDGKSDITPGVYQPAPPPDNRPGFYNDNPLNTDNAVPSGAPSAGANKGKNRDVAPSLPSNNLPNSNSPYFPGHGGLAPSFLPNPSQYDQGLPGLLPQQAPQRQPLPFAEPDDIPKPRLQPMIGLTVTPSEGGVVTPTYAEVTPSTGDGATVTASEESDAAGRLIAPGTLVPNPSSQTPTGIPQTSRPVPTSDALAPIPKVNTFPSVKTDTELSNDKTKEAIDQQKKDFDEQIAKLTAIATAIAALTPAINGIPKAIADSPDVKESNKATIQGAVCELAQPDSCLGAPIKQAEDAAKANGTKLDELNTALGAGNAGANAAQLALLQEITTKLGGQVTGGISGFMQRIAENQYIDKAIQMMTLATTLHNALMLSNNIGQTLGQVVNSVLGLVGIKGADGQALDVNTLIGKTTQDLIKGAVGEENFTTLSTQFALANRIYQSTANVFNSVVSLGDTVMSALELIGGMNAKVANALLAFRTVGEKAYERFNPQPNYKFGKLFGFLENADNAANTINNIVQVPVTIIQQVNETTEAVNALKANLAQPEVEKKGTTNPVAAKEEAKAVTEKAASVSPILDSSDKVNANE